jgi:multiple sugar transport system substrate-binding protein
MGTRACLRVSVYHPGPSLRGEEPVPPPRNPTHVKLLRPLLFLAAALLGASGASGCAPSRADARTELRFCFFGGYEEWKLWQRIAREFEAENPDIRMKLLYWPGPNYEDKVRLVMAAGTAPDILSAQDEPFPAYCELNQFEDLTPYITRHTGEYAPDRYFPTSLEAFQYKGKQRALPWNGGQLMVYYNKALFREAGLSDPPPRNWTMDQFKEHMRRLTKDHDGDGRIDQFGYEINANWMYCLIPYVWDFGTDVVDAEKKRCTLNTPAGVAALKWLRDLRWTDHVAPTAAEFTGAGGAIFMTGKLGMEINGPWRLPFMRETDVEWDVWHMPVGPEGERWTRGTWDGLAMYRQSKLKEEAWRFIRYATGKKGQHAVASTGRAVPPRKSEAYSEAFTRPDTPQHEERFLEGMSYFRTQRIPLRWSEMNVILTRETEAMLTRTGDAKVAAERMERDINKILDGR